jgi:phosphocarrier protein
MVAEQTVVLMNRYGLHARTSMALAQVAGRFRSEIRVAVDGSSESSDAKSIIGLLTLGAAKGTRLRIRANGDDAKEAADAIVRLVESHFDGVDGDLLETRESDKER